MGIIRFGIAHQNQRPLSLCFQIVVIIPGKLFLVYPKTVAGKSHTRRNLCTFAKPQRGIILANLKFLVIKGQIVICAKFNCAYQLKILVAFFSKKKQPVFLKMGFNIFGRFFATGCTGLAAFQRIIGQVIDVFF